jgi:hypothetical protein
MCHIIPSWCRIHRISLGLVHINSRSFHIIWFYRCSYTCIRIQLNASPSLFRYLDKSMCLIIPYWCRIHGISLGLVYINSRHSHIIWFYRCSYTCIRIQLNVSPSLFRYLDMSICFIIPSLCSIHWISLGLVYITTRHCHIIWFYHCSYTGISIHLNLSLSLFHISRQFDVRYYPFLVPYTPHDSRISIYKHWTLLCYMTLLLFVYRYK